MWRSIVQSLYLKLIFPVCSFLALNWNFGTSIQKPKAPKTRPKRPPLSLSLSLSLCPFLLSLSLPFCLLYFFSFPFSLISLLCLPISPLLFLLFLPCSFLFIYFSIPPICLLPYYISLNTFLTYLSFSTNYSHILFLPFSHF